MSGMYKGNSEAIIRRFVTLPHAPLSGGFLPLFFSVEELAKKKGVSMAQIAIAWSLKRVTAPIVGTTKLQNLKEMIGEWDRVESRDGLSSRVLIQVADALDIELTEEEAEYLEEPYLPNAIIGYVARGASTAAKNQ